MPEPILRTSGTARGSSPASAGRGPTVCAVVVTRDRRELLEGCLERLQTQTRRPDLVLVFDNASSDGTREWLNQLGELVRPVRSEENLGGAGGFAAGLAAAHAEGFDWIWLMDDDTWPEPTALEALLAGADRAPGPEAPLLLASVVRWKDGRLHPMNEPWFAWRRRGELVAAVDHGLLHLRHATFVSLLVARRAVDLHGGPLAHYFVSTEDFEWSGRILRHGTGYLVPESVVLHHTVEAHTPGMGPRDRFHWFVRNSLLMLRGPALSWVERAQYVRMALRFVRGFLARHGWEREAWRVVARGVWAGLRDPVR